MFTLRRLLKRRNTSQNGMALLLTLILMALGMLLLVPLLGFMATGLNTTYQVFDPKARELYAADAGVREALWRIRNQDVYPLPAEDSVVSTSADGNALGENGDNITIQISNVQISANTTGSDNLTAYRITSVARDPDTGQETSIDALVYSINLTLFADKIITSPSSVPIQPGSTVDGNDHPMWVPEGWTGNNVNITDDTPVENAPILGWPTASSLIEFYSDNIDKTAPTPSYIGSNGVIEVSEDMSIGPLYYEGDLTIVKAHGSGVPAGDLTVNLAGTVYIKGSLTIGKNIILDLYDPVTPDPTTALVSHLFPVSEGVSVLTVDNTSGFPSAGTVLVKGLNPEYLKYTNIDDTHIILEGQTQKEHYDGDPVEAFLRTPNTIFIEGEPDTWNFSSSTDCTINGPGAIIATGDIEFLPKVDADSGFVYVMSLGTVKFQPATSSETPPSGFTGSVVAREFLPMHRSNYTYPPEGYPLNLNIPMGDTPTVIGGIAYWDIR